MPEPQYLVVHQTHPDPITPYEEKLSGAIMEIFATGVHDLPGLVEQLDGLGLRAPDGTAWDQAGLRAELRRLGR